MRETTHRTLLDNKRLLRSREINLNYLRSIIVGDNSTLIICLEEYLRNYYNASLRSFMTKYNDHESLAKLCLEMKSKEMGIIGPEIKSFNI